MRIFLLRNCMRPWLNTNVPGPEDTGDTLQQTSHWAQVGKSPLANFLSACSFSQISQYCRKHPIFQICIMICGKHAAETQNSSIYVVLRIDAGLLGGVTVPFLGTPSAGSAPQQLATSQQPATFSYISNQKNSYPPIFTLYAF
jgi:hypothetical protein